MTKPKVKVEEEVVPEVTAPITREELLYITLLGAYISRGKDFANAMMLIDTQMETVLDAIDNFKAKLAQKGI